MRGARWFVGIGALLTALVALYVLTRGAPTDERVRGPRTAGEDARAAMDEIDAESREAMREILREAGDEEQAER